MVALKQRGALWLPSFLIVLVSFSWNPTFMPRAVSTQPSVKPDLRSVLGFLSLNGADASCRVVILLLPSAGAPQRKQKVPNSYGGLSSTSLNSLMFLLEQTPNRSGSSSCFLKQHSSWGNSG